MFLVELVLVKLAAIELVLVELVLVKLAAIELVLVELVLVARFHKHRKSNQSSTHRSSIFVILACK